MLAREVFPTPEFKALAKYFVFVHIDVDQQPGLGQKYGARALPTIVYLKNNGEEVHRTVGAGPVSRMVAEARTALQKAGIGD